MYSANRICRVFCTDVAWGIGVRHPRHIYPKASLVDDMECQRHGVLSNIRYGFQSCALAIAPRLEHLLCLQDRLLPNKPRVSLGEHGCQHTLMRSPGLALSSDQTWPKALYYERKLPLEVGFGSAVLQVQVNIRFYWFAEVLPTISDLGDDIQIAGAKLEAFRCDNYDGVVTETGEWLVV